MRTRRPRPGVRLRRDRGLRALLRGRAHRRARRPGGPTRTRPRRRRSTTGGEVTTDRSPSITLDIAGMTCASCAQRIERKLNKLDGVTASVSYATEKAVVAFPDSVTADDLVATVVAAGYAATPLPVVRERPQPGTAAPDRHEVELAALRQRLVVSALLTVPVVADGDGARPAVRPLAVGSRSPWPRQWRCGGRGRSTARRGPTCATAPPPWTPWSRWACSRRSAGRWWRSSPARRGIRA